MHIQRGCKNFTKGKHANVLSPFSLKGSHEGFRSDRLNHLIVCGLPQQFVWWKVNSCMLARRKACNTFPVLERKGGMTTNLLTKIKCFLLTGEVVLHPILGALNKPSLRIVKKKYSSLPFAFTGILPLPGHSRFVKIYLIRQSLTAFCFSLRPPSSGYSCIRHYLLVPYGF